MGCSARKKKRYSEVLYRQNKAENIPTLSVYMHRKIHHYRDVFVYIFFQNFASAEIGCTFSGGRGWKFFRQDFSGCDPSRDHDFLFSGFFLRQSCRCLDPGTPCNGKAIAGRCSNCATYTLNLGQFSIQPLGMQCDCDCGDSIGRRNYGCDRKEATSHDADSLMHSFST